MAVRELLEAERLTRVGVVPDVVVPDEFDDGFADEAMFIDDVDDDIAES